MRALITWILYGSIIFWLVPSAEAVLITNGDFSSGLTGYTTVGMTSTAPSYTYTTPSTGFGGGAYLGGTISPTSGSQVTQLRSTGGVGRRAIESALGLPNRSLQNLSNSLTHSSRHYSLTNGSAIQTSFTGSGTLSFDWNFWREDYTPYNDISFFTISGPGLSGSEIVLLSDVNGSAEALAATSARGPGGGTGWQGYSYLLPGDGVYTIGFGVIEARDAVVPSFLHIDNIQASVLVPEASPALTAALMAVSGLGLTMRRRRIER